MKRINLIGFVGDEISVKRVIAELDEAGGDDIELYLHSSGGLIYEALGIYQQIKKYSGKVIVRLGGLVASAMTYISTAGDEIIAEPSTAYMIHNVWSCICGDYLAMEKEALELKRINQHTAERLSELSGKKVGDILKMMDKETWLYGKEIVDIGFATKLEESEEPDQSVAKFDKENYIIMGKQEVKENLKKVASIVLEKTKGLVKNEPEEIQEASMAITKEEAIEVLKTEMTSNEIAKACNVKILTKDNEELLSRLQEAGIDDPIAKIEELENTISSNADELRSAKLTEAYGKKSDENLERNYAEKVTATVSLADLDDELKKLKTDPVMVNFAKQRADNNSALNILDGEESEESLPEIIEC